LPPFFFCKIPKVFGFCAESLSHRYSVAVIGENKVILGVDRPRVLFQKGQGWITNKLLYGFVMRRWKPISVNTSARGQRDGTEGDKGEYRCTQICHDYRSVLLACLVLCNWKPRTRTVETQRGNMCRMFDIKTMEV
jgi:hypothetical protein